MPQRSIGSIIRQRRLELGMTQEDLAELVSSEGEWLNQADISRVETGAVKLPRPARLQRIADAIGLSLGDLLSSVSGVDEEGQVLVDSVDRELEADQGTYWDDPGFYRRILDSVQESVVVTDPDGTIRYWNSYAEQLFGWTSDEAIGCNTLELVIDDAWEWQEQAAAIIQHLKAGQRWSGEFRVRNRHGYRFRIMSVNSPVLDHNGNVEAIVGWSHEVP